MHAQNKCYPNGRGANGTEIICAIHARHPSNRLHVNIVYYVNTNNKFIQRDN